MRNIRMMAEEIAAASEVVQTTSGPEVMDFLFWTAVALVVLTVYTLNVANFVASGLVMYAWYVRTMLISTPVEHDLPASVSFPRLAMRWGWMLGPWLPSTLDRAALWVSATFTEWEARVRFSDPDQARKRRMILGGALSAMGAIVAYNIFKRSGPSGEP